MGRTKSVTGYTRFAGGISDFTRESLVPDSFAWGRSVDIRTDPQNITILPRTIKESGSVLGDLPKWLVTVPSSLDSFVYGDMGNFYKRTSAGSYSNLRMIANSHGNGLAYFAEDAFVYYTLDKVIGRYGPLTSASPQFTDDFLGAQGGVPLNTNSLDLEAASSQYADRVDSASLSITGNIAIEAQIKPESLPAVGSSMTLVSKWDESGATRSYLFDIYGISGYFGDSSDGNLTISVNTVDSPIDSVCTGTSGSVALSATNASFAIGQIILIHQSQGTGAGTWMRNKIQGYTAGTITLETPLNASYTSGAQVLVMKQYGNVTVNNSITWTAKDWNGTTGGILAFLASGVCTINGIINANGSPGTNGTTNNVGGGTGGGFRGGNARYTANSSDTGYQAEGTLGPGGAFSNSPNGNGGGAPSYTIPGYAGAAGAGSNGTAGGNGGSGSTGSTNGLAGLVAGSADLTTMVFGGGGAGDCADTGLWNNVSGGSSGGGIIFITAVSLVVAGTITANGGSATTSHPQGAAAGGGGSILFKVQTATLGTGLVTAIGGTGTLYGGTGGNGRIHIDYLTSYSGTTTPTLDFAQDNTLVTSTTYQLRFGVSDDGTANEILTKNVAVLTALWQHVAVSWEAATSTATFFLNAVSQGTSVGTKTAIDDNASRFAVGKNTNGAGAAANFYDGLIDEVRVWDTTKTAGDFFAGINTQISTSSPDLQAYYKFNGDYTDATANGNNLTSSGSPVFVTDVPFPSPTTRLDIDQSDTTTSATYTTPIAISEAATERKVFTPTKDPQKSIAVLVAAVGTGDWTLTVHDQYNNVIATKTVTNANMTTGYFEFTFSEVWRPLTNFTNDYHFHLTSTVADGTVTTGSADDLDTVSYRTYFQFLVTDSDYHFVAPFLNFLVFGNERYLAKYEATLYEPNFIVFPAGWRARCYAFWREYLAVGMWKGDSITDFDAGRIYFWDGISPTFNFYIDVPEGGINAMLGAKGVLHVWAGYQGDHLVYQGGDTADRIKRLPKVAEDKYTEIFPQGVTMWKSLIRYGASGNSDSTEIQKGVYTWGHTNLRYPEILTYDYPLSTGNYTGTSVRVGLVSVVNRKLLIGWQDNVSYGMDYVDSANAAYPTATIEFLIDDENEIWKVKEANSLVANFATLSSGQSVSLKYKVDGASAWTANPDSTSSNDTVSRLILPDGRNNQIQVALDLATSVSTGPTINGVALENSMLETEGLVG